MSETHSVLLGAGVLFVFKPFQGLKSGRDVKGIAWFKREEKLRKKSQSFVRCK